MKDDNSLTTVSDNDDDLESKGPDILALSSTSSPTSTSFPPEKRQPSHDNNGTATADIDNDCKKTKSQWNKECIMRTVQWWNPILILFLCGKCNDNDIEFQHFCLYALLMNTQLLLVKIVWFPHDKEWLFELKESLSSTVYILYQQVTLASLIVQCIASLYLYVWEEHHCVLYYAMRWGLFMYILVFINLVLLADLFQRGSRHALCTEARPIIYWLVGPPLAVLGIYLCLFVASFVFVVGPLLVLVFGMAGLRYGFDCVMRHSFDFDGMEQAYMEHLRTTRADEDARVERQRQVMEPLEHLRQRQGQEHFRMFSKTTWIIVGVMASLVIFSVYVGATAASYPLPAGTIRLRSS